MQKNRGYFQRGCLSTYNVALWNGWHDKHVWSGQKTFPKGYPSVYNVAWKKGWQNDFFGKKGKKRCSLSKH